MEKITFWGLISSTDKKICIPTIQRDYALGRHNKVDKRSGFLNALKTAVCTDAQLSLDFVYGVDNETTFILLDGQQRLTTLWLLYWYIAYKAGILGETKIKEPFLKFSYKTRISSTDFCKSLCSLKPIPTKGDSNTEEKMSIRTWIMQQTWFYYHYKQDPTIMGMLNMIAGTKITDKNGNDIVDGLEELFSDKDYDFLSLWDRLTTSECINFHKLEVSLSDSDELYVKMNARGRQLTDFENFKTELVQYVKDENILGETEALDFAAKLDVQWTDIFWKNRSENLKTKDISIDEIYFAFIRRYVRLECIKKYGDESTLINKISKPFIQFEPYKQILDKQSIKDFINIMDNLHNHVLVSKSSWGEEFDFIPKYLSDKKLKITAVTNTQLLIFYGCCRYLLHEEYDDRSFSDWNRILWNICENRVDKSKFSPTISEIDILDPYSHDILTYLSGGKIDCNFNKEQLQEEQCKARKLLSYPSIKDMECYAFFKGTIRFLYTEADGKEDWNSFGTKAENIKKLIPTKKERHTIKLLTPYFPQDALCSIYFDHWTSNNDEDLRSILLEKKAVPYLHNFLLQNKEYDEPISILHQDIIDLCENAFEGKGCLQTKWSNESKYIWTNYVKRQGYYKWMSFIIGNEHYKRLSFIIENSKSLEIDKDQRDRKIGGHIQALYLNFKYEEQAITLYGNNTICMMKDEWEDKLKNSNDPKGYYCSIENANSEEELIEMINSIRKTLNSQNTQ